MDQYQFVEERLAFYDEQGLTPEPGGEWQEAHYPDPKGVGDKTVWMTFNDHQQQGLYQSEEHGRCCFYNYDTFRFLTHGPFVPGWFDLWDLYDKWKGEAGREHGPRNGFKNVKSMNDHINTKRNRSAIGKRTVGPNFERHLVANGEKTGPRNMVVMNGHPNTQANRIRNGERTGPKNSEAMNSHENTQRAREEVGLKTSKPVLCVETGEVYSSAHSASRVTGVLRESISKSCRRGSRGGGYHWEFVGVGG